MKFDVLTLFPEMFEIMKQSIFGKAIEKGIITLQTVNIRDFSKNKHKKVDDTPYGGGAGMVMMPDVVYDAYQSVASKDAKVIYMSPQGKPLNQKKVEELAKQKHLIILCGHYEGIDQRVLDKIVDEEISIGDYVLTGGEIPDTTPPEGEIIINGGKINDTIRWFMNSTPLVTINNGEIDTIDATLGCDCIINGGKVNEMLLGNSGNNINITIGDKEQDVNYTNPEIKSIRTITGDLAAITAIINFYNGIVKGEFNSSIIGIAEGEFNTRTGYTSKYDSTIDGTILVQN